MIYADDRDFLVSTFDAFSKPAQLQGHCCGSRPLGLMAEDEVAKSWPLSIAVDSNLVDSVDSFVYPGSLLSSDVCCRKCIHLGLHLIIHRTVVLTGYIGYLTLTLVH